MRNLEEFRAYVNLMDFRPFLGLLKLKKFKVEWQKNIFDLRDFDVFKTCPNLEELQFT